MKPLTEAEIRAAIVNVPADETHRIPLPGLHEVIWDEREYLGWRDPQAPQRGWMVFWRGDTPTGLAVRASDSSLRAGSAMCSLCQTLQPAGQVRMFSARKAGAEGHAGGSVATYICADLACSILIRIRPPMTSFVYDEDEMLTRRTDGLLARLASFTERVLADAA